MNVTALLWAQKIRGCKVIEHDILYRFAVAAASTATDCYLGVETIAFQLETNRRHVQRAIRSLESKGFVERDKRTRGIKQTSNSYSFHFERYFPKTGHGEERGTALLSKMKVFLKENISDEELAHLKGLKSAWLDEHRRSPRLWVAVESKTHMNFFLQYIWSIQQHFAKLAGAEMQPDGTYKPVFKILPLQMFATGDE